MEAIGSGPRIRTGRVVINSHASPPRAVDQNKWWSNGVTLPARRSCKDHLHPCACPVVSEWRSARHPPRFQRGASTKLASQTNWRGQGESNSRHHVGNVGDCRNPLSAWCLIEVTILASHRLRFYRPRRVLSGILRQVGCRGPNRTDYLVVMSHASCQCSTLR